MAKFTAIPLQTVAENQNVQFSDAIRCHHGYVLHAPGSGLVTIRGIASGQRFARYRITFTANIQIPADGTVEAISLALAVDGEPLGSATAIVTPAAIQELWNVSVTDIVDVPCGCCVSVAVRNTSEQAIEVQNSNLIIERIA